MSDSPNRKKWKIPMLYILLAISIVSVTFFAIGLGRELYISSQGQLYYSTLASSIETRPRRSGDNGSVTHPPSLVPPTDHTGNTGNDIDGPSDQQEPAWLPYVDFEALDANFPGISAWIQLEGTTLDYPVMQGNDNHYFLGHLPDGTKQRSGSIFLDYRNAADFSDRNTLIYGHESRTGDMFGILKSYRKQAFYEENPVMFIFTPENDYELVLIAGYLVNSGVESPPLEFRNDDAFYDHIATIKRNSFFQSDIDVDAKDRIVSLCTCAYDFPNARLVIVGKLV